MNVLSLNTYFTDNNIPAYHGVPHIDALRALSQQDLPFPIKEHVTTEYDKSIIALGNCRIDDFGERLFEYLNGSEFPIITDLDVEKVTVEGLDFDFKPTYTDVVLVNVHFPYFARLNKYWSDTGFRLRVKEDYLCYDIRSNGESLIVDALNHVRSKPWQGKMTDSSYSPEMPWIFDDGAYMIKTHGGFNTPYNGITSDKVLEILRGMNDSGRYNYSSRTQNEQRRDFVNRTLIEGLSYTVGEQLKGKYRIHDEYSIKEFNKKLAKFVQDIW